MKKILRYPPDRVKSGTIGVELPGITTRLVDENGSDVSDGCKGQLLVRGGNVMQGYWHRPEETARTLAGGWLHTGDIAVRDSDGYLRIVDRLKEMIISMGENIYPREIEELLYEYPHIRELPSSAFGQARGHVGCCCTVEPGAAVDKWALKKYLQQNLALFKVPRIYYEIDEMPRLATGKIAKKELERRYASKQS